MNITTTYDEQFTNCKLLKWLPFVGTNYPTAKVKTLLIGESHYYDPNDEHQAKIEAQPNFTRLIAYDAGVLDLPYASKLYKNITTVFSPKTKEEFWGEVAYMNIVQRAMTTIDERPTPNDFVTGWKAVQQVVDILQPTQIICLGVEASHHFEPFAKENNVTCTPVQQIEKVGNTFYRTASLMNIPVHFIQHPAKYFSPEAWRTALLNQNAQL